MEKVEIDIDGKLISLEAGDLARQAGGAVIVRQGDTMVLVAATMAGSAREAAFLNEKPDRENWKP